jgi:hypothetical protein
VTGSYRLVGLKRAGYDQLLVQAMTARSTLSRVRQRWVSIQRFEPRIAGWPPYLGIMNTKVAHVVLGGVVDHNHSRWLRRPRRKVGTSLFLVVSHGPVHGIRQDCYLVVAPRPTSGHSHAPPRFFAASVSAMFLTMLSEMM